MTPSPLLHVHPLRFPASKPPLVTRFPLTGVDVGVGVEPTVGVAVGVIVGVGVGVECGVDVGVGVEPGVGVGVGGVGVGVGPVVPPRPLAIALSRVSAASSPSRENIMAPARPLLLMYEVLAAIEVGVSPV